MVTRRMIAIITSTALAAEMLFPPFSRPGWSNRDPLRFGFISSMPEYGVINVALLSLELATTIAIGWLLIRYVAKE